MHVDEKLTNETFPAEPEKATLEGKNKFVGFGYFLEAKQYCSLPYLHIFSVKNSTNGGPTSQEMFQMPLVFIMTMLLLTSSLTSVYAMYHMKNFNFKKMQLWLLVTVLLGLGFLGFEIYEFYHYTHEFKHTMRSSAFGSAFYALVGTHGLHVLFGLCWILTLIFRNAKRGLNLYNAPKFYVASIYWHFIDVVWVFIFTVVYLMGMVG